MSIFEQFGVVIEGDAPAALKLTTSQRTALENKAAAPAAAQAATLLGQWYDGQNYTGSAWVHTTTATTNPCPSPQDYLYGDVTNLEINSVFDGWGNRIRSFQGYNHCGFQLFTGVNFGGSSYGPALNAPTLGAFDQVANSLRMRYV